jgi:hypothetical protein
MMRLIQTISGRITWLFYLTSGLRAEEAFHDHVLLRDAIAYATDRVAESVAYAHIERDRQTSRSFAPSPYGHRVPRTAPRVHLMANQCDQTHALRPRTVKWTTLAAGTSTARDVFTPSG